jgi:hypothetical protein
MHVVSICSIAEISPHDRSNADIIVRAWMIVCAHVVCKNISMHAEFVTPRYQVEVKSTMLVH